MLHTAVYGVLVVGGCAWSRSPGSSWWIASCPPSRASATTTSPAFIYAALGVIYAVLLALVVISVWEEYQAASETVEEEANSVAEIFWLG